MEGVAKRSPLRPLTGLRFLAAILVVIGHYLFYFAQTDKQIQRGGLAGFNIFVHHAVGVDLFFILSGFILTYNYFDPSGGLRGRRRDFWIARIARIYPVYLLGLAFDLARLMEQSHHSFKGLIVSGMVHPLLLQAWVPSVLDSTGGWDPPSWSISDEALFYLLFPLLLLALGRLSLRLLPAVAAFSWLISIAIPAVLIMIGTHLLGDGHADPWWLGRLLYYNPLLRLPEFVLGMGIGLLFLNRTTATRPARAPRPRLPAITSLVSIPVLLLVLAVHYPFPSEYPVDFIFGPVLAVLIFSLAYNRGPVAYLLSSSLLVLLGEASYAVYIFHWPIWYWTTRVNTSLLHLPTSSPELGVIYFFLVIALSILSFLFIERPARAAIKARFARAQQPGAGVAYQKGSIAPGHM